MMLLYGAVAIGLLTLLYYYSWWVTRQQRSVWLELGLACAVVYGTAQLVTNWLIYLKAARRAEPPPPPPGLTVDVFVVAYKEPYRLVERTLRAACAIRGKHRTWLLDDGHDPALANLAHHLGAGYLTRSDRSGNRPGNINAALARTNGDIVVIFDTDHTPEPAFLERTLGYFSDPKVGFIQVMLTFSNAEQSWVARAATETSLDFYNPTSLGMDAMGSATMMGSNALIRRAALQSIGGYHYGLADDLATSIALHAANWQSVYVAEPLAPGLAPHDLTAWFTQQFKWARGVFEVQLTTYPRLFGQLSWAQRLAYALRVTYYWAGSVVCVHLLLTLAFLWGGSLEARQAFEQYLRYLVPVGVAMVLVRQLALQVWRHPSLPTRTLGNAISLVIATWPIYTVAWVMAVLRWPLTYRLTPKEPNGSVHPIWLFPQGLTLGLLGGGLVYHLSFVKEPFSPLLLLCAAGQVYQGLILFWHGLRSRHAQTIEEENWQPEQNVILS